MGGHGLRGTFGTASENEIAHIFLGVKHLMKRQNILHHENGSNIGSVPKCKTARGVRGYAPPLNFEA